MKKDIQIIYRHEGFAVVNPAGAQVTKNTPLYIIQVGQGKREDRPVMLVYRKNRHVVATATMMTPLLDGSDFWASAQAYNDAIAHAIHLLK